MNKYQIVNNAAINNQLFRITSYFLIIGMMVCFTIAFQAVGEGLFSGWTGNYLPFLAGLISLEALYSRRTLKKYYLSFIDKELWLYRVSEMVVIFISLRVFLYVYHGFDSFLMDLESFRSDRFSFINDGELIGVFILLLFVWALSTSFGEDVDFLQIKPSDLKFERVNEMDVDRLGAKKRLLYRILTTGMLIVFITIIHRSNLGQFFGESIQTRSATLVILVYFGFAVVLMSVSQFALLHSRWVFDQTPTQKGIVSRWALYTTIFLFFLILISVLLPTAYTYGLFETIRYIFSFFFYVTSFVLFVLIYVIGYIYYFLQVLLRLLGREGDVEPPPAMAFDQPNPVINTGDSMISIVLSIVFWTAFIMIGFFAIIYYLRQNEEILERIRSFSITIKIQRYFAWIISILAVWRKKIIVSVSETFSRLSQSSRFEKTNSPLRFLSLRSLSPKEKILFYYQAMLRRGKEHGIGRKNNQTPYQYMTELQKQLPMDADHNLEVMTESFLEARYSLHKINNERVSFVQQAWQYLRRNIRKLGKRG